MKIGGFQKLTLLDYPEKMACIVFTEGCNLRCPYCHNAPLVTGCGQDEVDEAEVTALLDKRRGILDGVVITGGEPLLQPGLEEFIDRIKTKGYSVKLDTNGTFPERLRALVESGRADYVAMDIKNCPDRYAVTAGVKNINIGDVKKSAEILMNGKTPYEFRTTVVKPFFDKACFEKIGIWLAGADKYYLQPFMDSGNLVGGAEVSAYDSEKTAEFLDTVKKYIPSAEIRGGN